MLRLMRPVTSSGLKRSNINIRKFPSKQYNKMHLGEYFNNNVNSNSPMKRRELYETPNRDKPKIILKVFQ